MPIIHRKPKEVTPYEKRSDLKKLYMHVTIVPSGSASIINKIYKNLGVSCTFTHRGKGTANKRVREILGLEDNHKDLIISLVPENIIPNISKELEVYFAANERNRGIGFTVKLESVISVRVYNFLADML